MKLTIRVIVVALSLTIAFGQAKAKSDAEIKQEIVKESIGGYKGSCACPFSKDRAGKSCGARSAYSKPSGASPICYDKDVTQKMVDEYRKKATK